jgi:WhiB family redox-sensing transcriptional regulator
MNDWSERAACRGSSPQLFFADGKGDNDSHAKAVCSTCEVQAPCLVYALRANELFGTWGGLNLNQRRHARRYLLTVAERRAWQVENFRTRRLLQAELKAG